MNNLCPTCGALYNVRPKDAGRRVRCKKCGSALSVTDAGLVLDGPAEAPGASAPADNPFADVGAAPPRRSRDRHRDRDRPGDKGRPEDEDRPRRGARPGGGLLAGFDPVRTFKDVGGFPTALFAAGAFLVIVFLFQPLIGLAKVAGRQADVEAAALDHKARLKRLERDNQTSKIPDAEKEYDRRRDELVDRVDTARVGNAQGAYWDRWGMMLGFLALMAGSVGFLSPAQPTVRRVVGAVVVTAQVVLVFIYFVVRGAAADVAG